MEKEYSQLLPWLYIGSKKAAKCRPLLRELNVTHVLNVTPSRTTDPAAGVPNYFEKDRALTYRRCSVFDTKAENLLGVLPGCVAFVDTGRHYGSVFVHCSRGVNRSAALCVAYLVVERPQMRCGRPETGSLSASGSFAVACGGQSGRDPAIL